MAPTQMLPGISNFRILQKREEVSKEHQKMNFDMHRKAKPLQQLESRQRVWISDMGVQGTGVSRLLQGRTSLQQHKE